MDCRPLEIRLFSANDIKDVNLFSKMDVHTVVSISDGPKKQKLGTPVNKDGSTNPKYNHSFKFTLDDAALQQDRLKLKINLISDHTLGDTKIGKAVISVKELLHNFRENYMRDNRRRLEMAADGHKIVIEEYDT